MAITVLIALRRTLLSVSARLIVGKALDDTSEWMGFVLRIEISPLTPQKMQLLILFNLDQRAIVTGVVLQSHLWDFVHAVTGNALLRHIVNQNTRERFCQHLDFKKIEPQVESCLFPLSL